MYNFVWELMGGGKKVEGKESIFCVKVSFFRSVSYKKIRGFLRLIV